MLSPQKRPLLIKLSIVLGILLVLLAGYLVFDATVDRSGWLHSDQGYHYRDFHGKKVTGWQGIDENTYYFDENHVMLTHWQEIDGNRYYFGDYGRMVSDWQTIGDSRYYFGNDGILRTGWLTQDTHRYYLRDDGSMVTGWLELEDGSRYFEEDGTMTTGWRALDTGTYYFQEDGTPLTGKVTLDDDRYYFLENGVMFIGWEDSEGSRHYYGYDGIQAIGWTTIEDKLYLFNEDGNMQTGWQQVGEYRYYLQEDGSAAVGPKEIDGALYHFSPKGIQVVLVNSSLKVPTWYKPDLVTFTGWHQVSSVCLDALTKMLEDCVAAGYSYEFNSAYRSIQAQQEILTLRTQEYKDIGYTDAQAYAKARETVALPGTSEHHLGLAVDVLNNKKAAKQALDWLNEHCWEYGFIVRYGADKSHITGIIHEPWHFRYVGTEVSMDMKDSGLCLEEYLGAA